MLIWVCALHCEAKPVIDFYRLKKSHDDNAFDLYSNTEMVCIVTGIGKVACAAACAWIAARLDTEASLAWINLGIAGAGEHPAGSLWRVNQIIDADTRQRYYPVSIVDTDLPASACLTLSQADENYQERMLFDMEASGFIYSCLRFSSAELVQSLKIISDNRQVNIGMDRQQVSRLIQDNMKPVDRQAQALLQLNAEIAARVPSSACWQRLMDSAHFSQTQKNRLRKLWRYLMNRGYDAEQLLAEQASNPASLIIENLEHLSHRDSERL